MSRRALGAKTKDRRRRPARDAFFAFDRSPPDARRCLDAVYAAFQDHQVSYGFCRQCFDVADEERMRRHRDLRTAPYDAFRCIYAEHPNCSNGEGTFKHWLPRALELGFFDDGVYPTLEAQIARLEVLAWPETEQAALRDLFGRAAINWFETGDAAPLGGFRPSRHDQNPECVAARDQRASAQLVHALIHLRVEAASVFEWLVELGTDMAWSCLADAVGAEKLFDSPDYVVADAPERAPALLAAIEALERRARGDLYRCVNRDLLLRKWEAVAEKNPILAYEISEADRMFDVYAFQQDEAERAADQAVISKAAMG